MSKDNIDILSSLGQKDNSSDNFWVLTLLLLVMLDFPKKEEEKQPIINIIIGGDE